MTSMFDKFKVALQLTAYGQRLQVRARTTRGQTRAETDLPSPDLLDRLVRYDPTDIPAPALRPVGQALYQCLTAGDVAKLVSATFQEGRRSKHPLHFELRFDADQTRLAQYPWEAIADDEGRFLVRDGLVNVTRYITYPQPPPALDQALQNLPILQVIAQPLSLQPLEVVDLALERLEVLAHATFEQFQHRLLIQRAALWALHFHGHGGLILQCRRCEALHPLTAQTCRKCGASLADGKQVGALAFERNGDAEWITTEQLGSVLYNAQVRLAMLLACETARLGNHLIFSGLAPGLVLAGVPAVVGMQYPVTDQFANSFARGFYQRLLHANDVLDALHTARTLHAHGSWYSPVLYLRHLQTPTPEETTQDTYGTRKIDTAAPAEVQAGVEFLVRLWIRRPETKPLTEDQLRQELGLLTPEPISRRDAEAEIRFEPVEGRKLRRGRVDIELRSPTCDVYPGKIRLFVDEHLDAPPAIFTVRARRVGRAALHFAVWQDGGQIAAITQPVRVLEKHAAARDTITTESQTLPVQDGWAGASPGFARKPPAPGRRHAEAEPRAERPADRAARPPTGPKAPPERQRRRSRIGTSGLATMLSVLLAAALGVAALYNPSWLKTGLRPTPVYSTATAVVEREPTQGIPTESSGVPVPATRTSIAIIMPTPTAGRTSTPELRPTPTRTPAPATTPRPTPTTMPPPPPPEAGVDPPPLLLIGLLVWVVVLVLLVALVLAMRRQRRSRRDKRSR